MLATGRQFYEHYECVTLLYADIVRYRWVVRGRLYVPTMSAPGGAQNPISQSGGMWHWACVLQPKWRVHDGRGRANIANTLPLALRT